MLEDLAWALEPWALPPNCGETLQGGCWSSTQPRANVPNFPWWSR